MKKKLLNILLALVVSVGLGHSISAEAANINSIEFSKDTINSKIKLDVAQNTKIIKKSISNNEIQIKLYDTSIPVNFKTIYNNNDINDIKIFNDAKNTTINIKGKNIDNYGIVFANNNQFVNFNKTTNDLNFGILALLFVLSAGTLSLAQNTKHSRNEEIKLRTTINASKFDKINTIKNTNIKTATIRNKMQVLTNLHEIKNEKFENFETRSKRNSVTNVISACPQKQSRNLKHAVNS